MRDDFKRGYIEAIFFTESGSVEDGKEIPKDATYSDFSEGAVHQINEDCDAFFNEHFGLWNDDYRAGIDFWLTRNGHGAGFWDGDYPEKIGRILTDAAKVYGEVNAYMGCLDGSIEIYFM